MVVPKKINVSSMKRMKDVVMEKKPIKITNAYSTDPKMQLIMNRQYLPKILTDVGQHAMHCTKFKRKELNSPKLIQQEDDMEYEILNGERKIKK